MGWFSKLFRGGRQDEEAVSMRAIIPAERAESSFDSGNDLPKFQNLGSEIGSLAGRSLRERDRVREAFSPSIPIQDTRLLAGRSKALSSLIRSIQDMKLHVVIYGERGIGKTSLLHVLKGLAKEARYHVAYHSCSDGELFSDVFRAVATEVPLLYHDRFGPSAEESERGGSLADQLPEGNFGVSQFSEALSHLSNTRLLIMLDEFDRSSPGLFRRNVAELIKNLSDRSVRVQLVIAGVAGNLSELIEHIPSIRRNVFSYRVPEMTEDEIGQMITIGERVSGLQFDEDATARIATLANGSPYLASLISQSAGFDAHDRDEDRVTLDNVVRAAKLAADELRLRLAEPSVEAIDRMTADGLERTVLPLVNHAMHSMGRLDTDKLEMFFATPSFPDLARDLTERYGLLQTAFDEREGRYRFREDGIAPYLWIRSTSQNIELAKMITRATR